MNMRVRRCYSRVLAVLFAVVMMVTSMPQTGLQAMAAQESTGITEAYKADGDAGFYDDSEELQGNVVGTGDDPSGTEEYVTYTFQAGEHVKIYNAEGTEEITQLRVPRGSEEEQEFRVRVDEGYVIRRAIDAGKSVALLRRPSQDYKNALYFLRPRKGGYQMDSDIVVDATPIAEHTVSFSYDPQMAEVSVTKTQGSVAQ